MRYNLMQHVGQRVEVLATFDRLHHAELTDLFPDTGAALFQNVRTDTHLLAAHLWLPFIAEFRTLMLVPGDVVTFSGVVTAYSRKDGRTDYALADIANVNRVMEPETVST